MEQEQPLLWLRVRLGRFDGQHGGAFFDIKSYSFEPQLRATFKRRLEGLTGGLTITIDGPGNHAPDIQEHAFGNLKAHATALRVGQIVRIPELGWTIQARPPGPGITTSEAEYHPSLLASEHRLIPLWYSSQFTTDAPC